MTGSAPAEPVPRAAVGAQEAAERAGFGPEIIAELRAKIPQIIDEIVALIAEDAPEYAALLSADVVDVQLVAEQAVEGLVRLAVSEPGPGQASDQIDYALFEELGRAEWRAGHTLRTLLAAYRTGARVAWRHLAATSIRQGMSSDSLALLAEAIFAFIDELSAASARGYAHEQSVSAGETERQLLTLAELLLNTHPDPALLAAAAGRVRHPLSATYAVVAAPEIDEELPVAALAGRLEPAALPVRRPGMRAALLPDPGGPGRRHRLSAQLRGWQAVIGWSAPAAALADSFAAVELALRLQEQGVLPTDDPTFIEDHLGELIVHREPALLEELRERRLSPLDRLPVGSRTRLLVTLREWLDHQGDRGRTAAALHVHPQTVRYRLGQLRRLLGAQLDDPQARFELQLALRCRPAAGRIGPAAAAPARAVRPATDRMAWPPPVE